MKIDVKNLAVIVIAVLIILLMIIFLPGQKSGVSKNTTESNVAEMTLVKVRFTDKGFEPSTITVKVGTVVEWTNETTTQMRIASNPHPTHLDLPGLDQGDEGLVYRYTFEKVGKWSYHNHYNPDFLGLVIAE